MKDISLDSPLCIPCTVTVKYGISLLLLLIYLTFIFLFFFLIFLALFSPYLSCRSFVSFHAPLSADLTPSITLVTRAWIQPYHPGPPLAAYVVICLSRCLWTVCCHSRVRRFCVMTWIFGSVNMHDTCTLYL